MLLLKFRYICIIGSREYGHFLYKPMQNETHPNGGHFGADFICMRKYYKPCPKDLVCWISEYLDFQFMRRRSYNIHQIWPLLQPIGLQICANLNPHSPKMLPTKFGWNQFKGKVYGRTSHGHGHYVFGSGEIKRERIITALIWKGFIMEHYI